MIDSMQFAAAAAAWCLRQGISTESVGLTMGQDGRFACTSNFKLVGVYTDGLPAEFGFDYLEMGEYGYQLADIYDDVKVYVYCRTHGVSIACIDVENGHCSECSDEFHRELLTEDEQYTDFLREGNWPEKLADALEAGKALR